MPLSTVSTTSAENNKKMSGGLFYRSLLTVDLFIHKWGEFRISIPCSRSLRSEVLT